MKKKPGRRQGRLLQASAKQLHRMSDIKTGSIEARAQALLEEHGFDAEGARDRCSTPDMLSWLHARLKDMVIFLVQGNDEIAGKMAHVAGMFSRGEFVPDFGGSSEWLEPFLPQVLPPKWRQEQTGMYMSMAGQKIIVSGSRESDGNRWVHMSTGFSDRLPSWDELKQAKELIFGDERWAVQVLPVKSKYVNIAPYVLHLFHCVDNDVLPDFTGGTGSL